MLTLLKNLTGFFTTQGSLPRVKSKVKGFTIKVERVQDVLLKAVLEDESAQPIAASVDYYFKVTVTHNGTNKEYPHVKTQVYTFTLASDVCFGSGFVNNVVFAPAESRWLRFEFKEEFDDGKRADFAFGKRLPPHHKLMLTGHFRTADGKKLTMGVGGTARKSEEESREWQAALRSSVNFIW